jgi:hypothetical protein
MLFAAATALDSERKLEMRHPRSRMFWLFLYLLLSSVAASQTPPANGGDFSQGSTARIPDNVILVKGAWSSASDAVTPLPESGQLDARTYGNPYFGIELPLPKGWVQKYEGPPPSDSGYYVLAQLRPAQPAPGQPRGTLLIAAQDLFFSTTQATDPLQLINYTRDHLQADYRVETPPREVALAGRTFVRFEYVAPVAGLHWSILATEIRCHVVEFVVTSADTRLVEALTYGLGQMKLGDSDSPVCLANYAIPANILHREDPIFSEHKYNPIPVRVIIDRDGKVKHVHFLSAFPSQSQALTTALMQWRFKPYLRDGQPVEVETGILFGRAPRGGL